MHLCKCIERLSCVLILIHLNFCSEIVFPLVRYTTHLSKSDLLKVLDIKYILL